MSASLDQAFALAAGELGLASASWLFAKEVHACEGRTGIENLRDALGRTWPVLDAICAAWLDGLRGPTVDASVLVQRMQGLRRLVLVGLESHWLDLLLPQLPEGLQLGLLRHSEFDPDWLRVRANLGERVELLDLADFQSWAGARSGLLSFVYGGGSALFALSSWARVYGPDVRTQFRELIGWDVLQVPISIYPRWLVAVPPDQFTFLLEAE